MADNKQYYLDKVKETMDAALLHEQQAEFSLIAAGLLLDELEAHPEIRGTKTERDFLKRNEKHIRAAKYHAKQVEKLEKKYNYYQGKADAALSD